MLSKDTERAGIIWNLIGSTIYALTSIVLGAAVVRILDESMGGIFLFAFTTLGQHIFIISYFGIRPVQVTDTRRRYRLFDYLKFRYITCGAALVFAILFALFYSGIGTKTTVIILIAIYKVLDGLADCFESEFQRDGRLDMTGKSLAVRTLISMSVFILTLILSHNLVIASFALVVSLAICICFICTVQMKKIIPDEPIGDRPKIRELFKESAWLFAAAFLDLYIFAASKYAIDYTQTEAVSGYYSIIFIPAQIINLLANFVIRPVLTKMSEDIDGGDRTAFTKLIMKISGLIAILTAVGALAAFAFAIPALNLVLGAETGAKFVQYKTAIILLIAGGGFYALLNLLYYALVILKKQRDIFFIYVAGCIIGTLSFPLAAGYSVNGGAVGFIIAMAAEALIFAIVTWKSVK